ncbi:hypothetical protein ACSNOI_30815 [Actinomadura kijaniata]|uniref:hypothetical protein n=1 Tax=Actinomadura kijaniata TaxID=46161 RepID=UPI003F1B0053
MAAGFDTAVADLLDWLAGNAAITELIERTGNALWEKALPSIEAAHGPARARAFRSASTDHFWCGVLAAFACSLAELQKMSDRVRERATTALLAGERLPLGEEFTAEAIQRTWDAVAPLFTGPRLDEALWAMRGLAILICPAPERHPEVSRCCLDPIAGETTPAVKAVIAESTKERLMTALPHDWLPRTRASLGL